MRRRKHPAALVVIAALVGCGDDSPLSESESTAASTGTATSTSTATSASTSTSTSASTSTSTTDPAETGTTLGDTTPGATSTGAPGDVVWLQNDDWALTDNITWQAWPGIGDCWGATYEIDAGLYPFDIVELEVAIGGAGTTQTFEVGVWNVDGDNMPVDAIDTAMVDVEGDVGLEPHIDLAGLLDLPTVTDGTFAVVMCHTDHMGAPSIATDVDGNVDGANNWVFQQAMGQWVSSPDFFGIDGDFIMRTGVVPAP